ncbi:Uncharacterised protein [Mycobacteroides abscessus subsp. massiliense]|nr:Uncharacterised protein [Mycobacteroides abscessus subsp. massiliense]
MAGTWLDRDDFAYAVTHLSDGVTYIEPDRIRHERTVGGFMPS